MLLARVRNLDATRRLRGRTSWIGAAHTRLCKSRFPLRRWRLLRLLLMPYFPRLLSYPCHDFMSPKTDRDPHQHSERTTDGQENARANSIPDTLDAKDIEAFAPDELCVEAFDDKDNGAPYSSVSPGTVSQRMRVRLAYFS